MTVADILFEEKAGGDRRGFPAGPATIVKILIFGAQKCGIIT
jgi:hypothetical protein